MGLGVKVLRGSLSPTSVVCLRFTVQSLLLLPWFIHLKWKGKRFQLPFKYHLFRGMLGTSTMLLFYSALHYLPLGLANLLAMTSMFWASVFAYFVFQEQLNLSQMVCGLVIFVGIGFSISGGETANWSLNWMGVSLGLAGGLSLGLGRTVLKKMRSYECTSQEIVFAFGLLGALFTLVPTIRAGVLPSRWETWLTLFAVGALGTCAQLLFSSGFKYTKVFVASVCQLNGTFLTLILGFIVLNEVPPLAFFLGMALVVAGILVLVRVSSTSGKFSKPEALPRPVSDS